MIKLTYINGIVFLVENYQVYAELEAIVDKLATDSQRGSYTIKKITGKFFFCNWGNTTATHFFNNSGIILQRSDSELRNIYTIF